MQLSAALLQQLLLTNHPGADREYSRAAGLVGLQRGPVPVLVGKLHAAVSNAGSEFVFFDAAGEHGNLSGPSNRAETGSGSKHRLG